jgi:uncharacterized coiled-coil protein SlyX
LTVIEFVLAVIGIVLGSSVVTVFVTGWLNRKKARADTRKSNADADNVVVDTSGDLLKMVRSVYEERIVKLEAQAETDHKTIIKLNQDVGKLRQAGEVQGERILYLEGQVALWKGYAKELVSLLRANGIQLPKWAEAINAR